MGAKEIRRLQKREWSAELCADRVMEIADSLMNGATDEEIQAAEKKIDRLKEKATRLHPEKRG